MSHSANLVRAETRHLPFLVKTLNEAHDDRIMPKGFTTIAEQANRILDKNIVIYEVNQVAAGFALLDHLDGPARITSAQLYTQQDEAHLLELILTLCFHDLGRNKITTDLLAGSAHLIKLYESLDFRIEVRKRQHYFSKSKFHHVLELAIKASEFYARD